MQQLYFSTSAAEHSGALGPSSENMDDVLNMGRNKLNGKYMRFQHSRAPLFDRQFCTNSDYDQKDFFGTQANKMLTQNFRPAGTEAAVQPKMDLRSTFSESFKEYTRKQSRIAKLPTQGPNRKERSKMPGSMSDSMLETTSFAEDQIKDPLSWTVSGLPPARQKPILPRHNFHINHKNAGTFESRYMSDFGVSPASTTHGRQEPLSLLADPAFPGLQSTCQPDVWEKSRATFLGAGR